MNNFNYGHAEDTSTIEPGQLMIIDEADLVFNNFVSFNPADATLNGLYHLKQATKAVYLSATFPPVNQNLINNCFGVYTSAKFVSQYQICSGGNSPFKIEDFNFQNEAEMMLQVKLDLIQTKKTLPLIYFIENWDDLMIDALDKEVVVTYGKKFVRIKDES